MTTDSNHPYSVYPNLMKDAKITGVNQSWVADITYIRILTAFVYLAVILDVFLAESRGLGALPEDPHGIDQSGLTDGD